MSSERRTTNFYPSRPAVLALVVWSGCASVSRDQPAPKSAAQPLYAAPADRVQTSTLLDFDNPVDSSFVDAASIRLADDPTRAGNRVLVATGSTRLNLTSLTRGRDVGGAWDVLGLRIWSDVATACDVTLIGPPTSPAYPGRFALAAKAWTSIWLETPRLSVTRPTSDATQTPAESQNERLQLVVSSIDPARRMLIDEVSLARSHVIVSESTVPRTNERWRVSRRGLQWIVTINEEAIFALPAAPFVVGGYRVMASDPTRALFENDAGTTVCIDRTGRLIENGRAKLNSRVLKFAKTVAENVSPALVEVVGNEGRIERSLPGDRDNDGYDETRGCYALRAVVGRATLRLTKQDATVKWPVLEVFDLPPGSVSVWLDGDIVSWAVRADDGRVIVELPIELERPVEVQIRVK